MKGLWEAGARAPPGRADSPCSPPRQVHVTDPRAFDPLRAATVLMTLLRDLYPKDFSWRSSGAYALTSYWIGSITGEASPRCTRAALSPP